MLDTLRRRFDLFSCSLILALVLFSVWDFVLNDMSSTLLENPYFLTPPAGPLFLLLTLAYILFFTLFLALWRGRGAAGGFCLFLSVLHLLSALFPLLVLALPNPWLAEVAEGLALFSTLQSPIVFYGFTTLLSWKATYVLAIGISLVWTLWTAWPRLFKTLPPQTAGSRLSFTVFFVFLYIGAWIGLTFAIPWYSW